MRSWRFCPECKSRATKLVSLNTGKIKCPICGAQYDYFPVNTTKKADECKVCKGSGFSGYGTGYGDVCGECGGTGRNP